jgi:hypothetical protein
MTRQAILERAAIVFQVMVLILGVITFRFNPNEPVFDTFSQALNVDISGDFFAILCAVGVVSSISVFRKRTMNEKAMAYIAVYYHNAGQYFYGIRIHPVLRGVHTDCL